MKHTHKKTERTTRTIWKHVFRPSCYGVNPIKMLDCVQGYMDRKKKICPFYLSCLENQIKFLQKGMADKLKDKEEGD